MKLIHKCVFGSVLLAGLIFSGCASKADQGLEDVEGDFYQDSVSETADSEKKGETKSKAKSTSSKKSSTKKTGFLEGFFASKFLQLDEGTLFTQQALGSIKQQMDQVVYYPKEELFGFGSPYMAAYYYFLMDDGNREGFRKAVDKYFVDFENKNLSRTDKKSFKAYGSIDAKVFWGATKVSSPNYGRGKLYLGYKFEGKNPYFTITMYACENDAYLELNNGITESLNLFYYFTKNQAKKLSDTLEITNLEKLLYEYELENNGVAEIEDDYTSDYDLSTDSSAEDIEEPVETDETDDDEVTDVSETAE